jgi:membrane protein DedA with SNARE-associated domain
LEPLIHWIVEIIGNLGYLGIVALMFLESSFFPFPSEVVVPPAGYLASKGEMSIPLILLSGILGSILGAIFNYVIAVKWGRELLIKYGKYCLINERAIVKAEKFFQEHGPISTFVGRLLPGIRQYISLPAGALRMPIIPFIIFTGLGSGIWVTTLAYIGFFIGNNEALLKRYLNDATIALILFCTVILFAYVILKKRRNHGKRQLP